MTHSIARSVDWERNRIRHDSLTLQLLLPDSKRGRKRRSCPARNVPLAQHTAQPAWFPLTVVVTSALFDHQVSRWEHGDAPVRKTGIHGGAGVGEPVPFSLVDDWAGAGCSSR